MTGFHPNCGTNVSDQATNESSVDLVRRMERVWEDAGAKLERARNLMKAWYDKHKRKPIKYQLGHPPTDPLRNWITKIGPYKVSKKVGASAYQLATQGQSTRHATFNEQLLKPYRRVIVIHRSLTLHHM